MKTVRVSRLSIDTRARIRTIQASGFKLNTPILLTGVYLPEPRKDSNVTISASNDDHHVSLTWDKPSEETRGPEAQIVDFHTSNFGEEEWDQIRLELFAQAAILRISETPQNFIRVELEIPGIGFFSDELGKKGHDFRSLTL